jgi:hypothetical protein
LSWGHRPKAGELEINSHVLDEAASAALKAVRVDRSHDVPYVGSCSVDGATIYIDYALPTHIVHKGKRFDVDRYIVMHEVVEMLFEHHLHFSYTDAHQIALRAERALVESDGLSWMVYARFCSQWSKRIGARRHFPQPPPDIDLQPEIDDDDRATLKRMKLPAGGRRKQEQAVRRRRRP